MTPQFSQNIQKKEITKIYYAPELDQVVAKNDDGTEAITHITPSVASQLVDLSTKNRVESVFLSVPVNPYKNAVEQGFQTANQFLFPILLTTLFIFVLRTFIQKNNILNNNQSNPFSNLLGSREDETKIIKMSLKRENISLASFGGSPEILEECMEVVSYIKNATDYKNAGAQVPKGILLEGPPGTGKTLLAKAIAAETDAYFISISASEFVELYVGVGAAKIRELFRRARENKPCIIFIDEIDAVGKKRGSSSLGGNDEREQTLNQLLSEMDGFTTLEDVLIIAATNRKDILDPALLRPGRFDRILNVPLPDRVSRKSILEVHSRGKHVFPEVDYEALSDLTAGLSGAELKNILNEAAIYAARRGDTVIYERDIQAAVEKATVGLIRRTETRSQEALRRVAIHEIGHAFLCFQFSECFDLKKVSIQGTYNGAGGYTLFSEKADIVESGMYTKELLKKRLIVALGGKAAETVFYGEDKVSVGSAQDLKEANRLARQMVEQYGMGDELSSFSKEENENLSEKLKELVDSKSRDLVIEAFQTAIQLVEEHRGEIEELVERILEKKTLNVLEFFAVEGLKGII